MYFNNRKSDNKILNNLAGTAIFGAKKVGKKYLEGVRIRAVSHILPQLHTVKSTAVGKKVSTFKIVALSPQN